MKNNKLGVFAAATIVADLILGAVSLHAQTNLNFNKIDVTEEGAIRLSWNSSLNEIYEIDEADSLIDTNTGSITWNVLYEDYPSQGTNTFWLDTGNYFKDPVVVHPKQSSARFYRIVFTGTNETPTPPMITVTSPASNDSLNGDVGVTVLGASDQPFLATRLYVDGQEMNSPDTSTNWTDLSGATNYVQDTYVINTCEWPNGSHTVYATARVQTGATGAHDAGDVGIGYGVSGFVPVTFSNLITRFSFSQPFFAPEDGQTQHVSAVFAANVNWTLEIQDANNSNVLSVTGSGGTLAYDWDGNGTGGTNVPIGNYTYLITAMTNGLSLPSFGEEETSTYASPDALSDGSGATKLWVLLQDGVTAVPFALYPPGIDTNSLNIFEEPVGWSPWAASRLRASRSFNTSASFASTASYSGASSQSSRGPRRPPIQPVKGRAGVYGVAYQTYAANGNGFTLSPPFSGQPGLPPPRIGLEGKSSSLSTFLYPPLRQYKREANNFIERIKKGNWSQGFAKVDDQLSINDLRASGANSFNRVKLGLLMLHGTYTTASDYNANQTKQIYFPITAGHGATYVRMNEMSLGDSNTNGLKWMAIAACNSMFHTSWTSMQNGGAVPYNGNLHILMGTDAVVWTDDHIMEKWAEYMTKGKGTNAVPMKIKDAWITAAKDAYAQSGFNYTNAMKFAYAGDTSCTDDTLSSTNTPGGTWTYSSQQVWP